MIIHVVLIVYPYQTMVRFLLMVVTITTALALIPPPSPTISTNGSQHHSKQNISAPKARSESASGVTKEAIAGSLHPSKFKIF